MLVAGSNRIAVLQEQIACQIVKRPNLRILECSFDAVSLIETLWWHPVYE